MRKFIVGSHIGMYNMFKKMFTQAIMTLLRAIGLIKKDYPKKMLNKTRADYVEKIKKMNDKK